MEDNVPLPDASLPRGEAPKRGAVMRGSRDMPGQAASVAPARGNYDCFPATVTKVYYGGSPPVGNNSNRTEFVTLRRCGVLRDKTYHYPVANRSFVAGEDASRCFDAQPLFGTDCPDYYVAEGETVLALFNRDPQGMHLFIKDEDPFVAQVSAVGDDVVTVKRKVWGGDPDGGSYAGPTFSSNVKDAAGSDLTFGNVRPESEIAGTPHTLAVNDYVLVMVRGRHMICRKIEVPIGHWAVCIDGDTGGLSEGNVPVSGTFGLVYVDITDEDGQALIPGPSREADGTYIPNGVRCQVPTHNGIGQVTAESPYEIAAYAAGGDYGTSAKGPGWLIRVWRDLDDATGWVSNDSPHELRATVTAYPGGAWYRSTVTINYASGYNRSGPVAILCGAHKSLTSDFLGDSAIDTVFPTPLADDEILVKFIDGYWVDLAHRIPGVSGTWTNGVLVDLAKGAAHGRLGV